MKKLNEVLELTKVALRNAVFLKNWRTDWFLTKPDWTGFALQLFHGEWCQDIDSALNSERLHLIHVAEMAPVIVPDPSYHIVFDNSLAKRIKSLPNLNIETYQWTVKRFPFTLEPWELLGNKPPMNRVVNLYRSLPETESRRDLVGVVRGISHRSILKSEVLQNLPSGNKEFYYALARLLDDKVLNSCGLIVTGSTMILRPDLYEVIQPHLDRRFFEIIPLRQILTKKWSGL